MGLDESLCGVVAVISAVTDHPVVAGYASVDSCDRHGSLHEWPHYAASDSSEMEVRNTVSDDYHMIGPGAHENAAMSAIAEGRIEEGQVIAILALASAVNRLAAAQEAIANV